MGRQLISVRKLGYVSEPEVAIVEVYQDRIANAGFVLKELETATKIDTVAPAGWFVRKSSALVNPVISIPPAPPSRRIVRFEEDFDEAYTAPPQVTRSNKTTPPESESSTQQARQALAGTEITVTSNHDGAVIIVNSAPTPHTTPYTFNGLDRGIYSFSLEKEGYEVQPDEISVSLTRSHQSELVAFKLLPDDSWPRPLGSIADRTVSCGY